VSRVEGTTGLLAWRALLRTHAVLTRDLDRRLRDAHGLSLSEYDLLHALRHAEGGRVRLGDLATQLLFTRAGITGLVAKLEASGLLERLQDERDRRGAYAVLTRAGRRRFERAQQDQLRFSREQLEARLTAEQLGQLAVLLTALGESPAPPATAGEERGAPRIERSAPMG